MTAAILFLLGLAASVAVLGLSAAVLHAHRRDSQGRIVPGFEPPVSIVKPLAGPDDMLEENLESFFRLDYPDFEVIFSFAREEDAAFDVARRVADRHPEVPSVFVVDGREPGLNAKVNRLAAGVRRARGRYFLFSDGNVKVEPGFLRRAVGLFRRSDRGPGLAPFPRRGRPDDRVSDRITPLERLPAGRDGRHRAVARACPVCVGKSILMSRAALNAIGGLSTLRDFLAEDFLLGTLVARAGYRSSSAPTRWKQPRSARSARSRLGSASPLGDSAQTPGGAGLSRRGAGEPDALVRRCGSGLGRAHRRDRRRAPAALLENGDRGPLGCMANRPLAPSDYFLIPLKDAGVAAVFWAGLFGVRTEVAGPFLARRPENAPCSGVPTDRTKYRLASKCSLIN